MTFYSDLQRTAASLLTDKGQGMTLTKRTPGAYDPATATAAIVETTHAVTGKRFDISWRDIDGTLVKAGDARVILSALGLTVQPATTDRLTISGQDWNIVDATPIDGAGINVAWKLLIRKS